MKNIKSDIEIARSSKLRPIKEVLAKIGVEDKKDYFSPIGHHIAKLNLNYIENLKNKESNLVLVTAITPTPAGEGKTTTSIGLADGLNKIGKRTIVCLREPSLGPSFGMKGGAAGGGYSQVIPMEKINLHFTGDFHAITSAHNLLSALIDNHVYWGNKLDIDVRRIVWRRVVDLNDRALRSININLGGIANGFPREDGFDITVASEIMAIFCLSKNINDLQTRIGNITIAYTKDKKPVFAKDLKAHKPMAALLKDAIQPNVVQTIENNPAFIHGGPFANIAHGCNSIIATTAAMKLSEYVVTEAGFGSDLGAEKFLNIKCRKAKIQPKCAVIVATVRALKMHGGQKLNFLSLENTDHLLRGLPNLERHILNLRKFGLEVIVAINYFKTDSENEINIIKNYCNEIGIQVSICKHWEKGGEGARDLAKRVVLLCNKAKKDDFKFLYPNNITLWKKIEKIAKEIYGANEVIANTNIRNQLRKMQEDGFGDLPICIAKTQYSFSTDPNLKGAPKGHSLPIREVRLSTGAEFIVVLCGSIMTMPGLPKVPAAESIHLNDDGEIEGLY